MTGTTSTTPTPHVVGAGWNITAIGSDNFIDVDQTLRYLDEEVGSVKTAGQTATSNIATLMNRPNYLYTEGANRYFSIGQVASLASSLSVRGDVSIATKLSVGELIQLGGGKLSLGDG